MFRIGKLQTVAGCRLRLPCDRWRLLEVANLIARDSPAIKSWSALVAGDPGLLAFCVDRFQSQTGRPPTGLKPLAKWARCHLADRLLDPNTLKPLKKSKRSIATEGLKRWRAARSSCQRSAVMFQSLKHSRPRRSKSKDSTGELKRWLRDSAKDVLNDPQFKSLRKHPLFIRRQRLDAGGVEEICDTDREVVLSLLQLAAENFRLRNTFADRLQVEKLAALKQLAYGASHEINNPLANIATGAQALLQSEPDADRRRRLANLYQQSMAAHDMISDLMLFAHPPAPVIETVDLHVLIAEIIKRSCQQGRSVAATFGVDVSTAELDRNQITIAIEALLRNAFEAIDQQNNPDSQPEVSIRVDVVKTHLRIFVVDNGPGFSTEQARHLFDPFYSGREAGRGLGFGLSKVYRIVQVHRGEVFADRDQRSGETTFLIRLPLTP